MIRELGIEVDRASWGSAAVPANFASGIDHLNIPEVLLTIGVVTSPSRGTGCSLAEYWAWVRYLSAISAEPNLSLIPEYDDIDSHQKTILSDDFGMGFSVYWLWKRMSFSFICDGRYFVDRYARHFGAIGAARAPGKRGPTKCPDFVFWQPAGRFHVVECKGTQSGQANRAKQTAAAQVQKTTITFPAARQGERLACAMTISLVGEPAPSALHVADPDGKPVLSITQENVPFAEDIMCRGLLSRVLSATGLPSTAAALAEPDVGAVIASRSKRLSEGEKERLLGLDRLRRERAEDELKQARPPLVFSAGGTAFVGRERNYEVPVAVKAGRHEMRRVIVRQGVSRDALESLEPSRFHERIAAAVPDLVARAAPMETASANGESMLQLGTIYRAELRMA